MKKATTSPVSGLALLMAAMVGLSAVAQPTCSINLGADKTICQGSSVILQGPAGFSNYLWSTGATSQNITVNTAGDYWCQVSYPSGNRVYNGDFSLGNTGFSSQYTYSPINVQNEGYYTVGPNASWYHNQFQGTGNGNFLIGNGGYVSWINNKLDVWCQTITCCPGQTYTMTFRGRTLSNEIPARILWYMDGALAQWPDFTFPPYAAGWQQFTTTWTAGPGQTSVNACLHVTSADGIGDDFGIDDINISATVVLRDTIHVSVTPLPAVNLGPDLALCPGDVVNLTATVPGGTYAWQDGSTNPVYHVTQPGTYAVTVTANNCANSDQVNITYNPSPTVHLGPDTVLCAGSTLLLSALSPGSTYLWQDGSTAPTLSVSQPGTYWAQATRNNCSARDTIVVGYKPMPAVALGNDTAICSGQTLLLNAAVPGATYLWQDASTAPTFTATAQGSYHVAVNLNGCVAQDTLQLTVNPSPTVHLGPDTVLCAGSTLLLSALSPGSTYLWQDGSTAPTLSVSQPGTYWAQATRNNCSARDTIVVGYKPMPAVALGNDTAICAGQTLLLNATVPGATYLWQDASTAATFTVTAQGSYHVAVNLNGCVAQDTLQLTVNPSPTVHLGPDTVLCAGSTLLLSALSPGSTYLWQDGSTAPTFGVSQPGTYWAQATRNNCSARDTIVVGYKPMPAVALGNDTAICAGQTLLLNAAVPGATYLWQDASTAATFTVTAQGSYHVAVNLNGCTAQDTVQVAVHPSPSVHLGPDTVLCAGSTLLLSALSPGSTYLWQDGSTAPTFGVSQPGTYWAQATRNNCSARDTIVVGYKPMPAVALGNDTAICAGQTLLLNAAVPGATYLWQDASTAATFTVTAQGSYHVAVNLNGCTAQDTVQVAVHPSPTVNIGPDQTICPGTSATFNATTAGATYLWSDGSTGPMLTTALPGTFSVLVTTGGCSTADTATVALFNLQTVNLGPDLSLCAGTTARIGATVPGATYLWNTGAATDSITVNAPGTYWLQVQLNGCIASDTVQVTIKPLPNFSLGPDRQVCPGGSTLLDAAIAGGAYLWSNGATSASITAGTGTWSVAVTVNGCTASGQVSVTELQPPLVNLGADTALCPGETITLDAAQPGCSYLWNTGQTSPQITVATALTAAVTVTDAHGCQGIGQVTISYAQPGNLNLGPDTAFCAGSTVTLNATMPGATAYLWNNGSTGPSLTTGTAGTYWARATVGNCTVGDTILLASVPAPAITLGNDTTLCPGETLLLQVPSTGLSVDWQDGSHGNSVLVTAPGQYGATVHNAAGCASTATIHVSYLAPHALSLGADTAICSGGSLQLNAGLPGGTTQWSGASQANTPSITVSGAGTYIATTTVTGCAVTDSIHITVHPLPVVALGPDTVMCEGSTLLLSATGQNLLWDNGSTNPNRVILHGGTYHVQASENGCSATDSITVEEHPVPVVSLPPDTSLCAGQLLNVNVALQGGTYAWNDGSTIPQRSLSPGTWHVRVMKAGCSASDTIHIAALPSPMLQLPQDTTLCAGQTWPINVDQPNSTFLWSTGNTLPLQLVQAPGTYGITVDREGCSASAWVNVEVVNLSSFSLGPDTLLCPGTSVQINADVPGTTVLWQDGSTALHRTVSAAGTYHATITAGGCSAASSIQVGVVDLPPVDLGADQVHCAGDTVHLHVAPGAAQVAWSNGSNGDEVQATSSGTWSVQLSLHGCHASDAVHISFLPVIDQLHLGPDRAYCAEQPLVLDATIPGASYSWNDGSQLATLAVHHPGIYWVHASGPCIQAADTVVIREGPCTPEVHVPNAFTPDGDGINDRFLPVVSEPVRHWSFMIFNRWGQQVFSSEDPGQGWDGMFGGQDAPVGIYTWDLHYTTVAPVGVIQERLRGSVALIR